MGAGGARQRPPEVGRVGDQRTNAAAFEEGDDRIDLRPHAALRKLACGEMAPRFLEAYALERLGHFKEALALTADIPEGQHTPNMVALRSVLLWRTGKSVEAKAAAEQAVGSGLDWLWAKATANNTLGYLAVTEERFLEAASLFKKSASLYLTTGEKNRWVGSLNNYAIALDRVAEAAEKAGKDGETLERLQADAEAAYRQTLQALEQTGENPPLKARILLNIGMLWERRREWDKAEEYYLEATPIAEEAGVLEISARLHLNLGFAYLKQSKASPARNSFLKAIDFAAKAGEFQIQGIAVGNLAFLDNDPDAIEIALELFKQSGNPDRLAEYARVSEQILKSNIEQALSDNNSSRVYQLLTRLSDLYTQLQSREKLEGVASAQKALLHIEDTRPIKDLLLGMLSQPEASLGLNGSN